MWNALGAKLNGSEDTLADRLIDLNVFTRTEYDEAIEIQKYGEVLDPNRGYKDITTTPSTPSTPSAPSTPSTPSTPSVPSTPGQSNTSYTYEDYLSWTPAQRESHMNSFNGDYAAYFAWYNAAETAYKEAQAENDIVGDGDLDLGELMKP